MSASQWLDAIEKAQKGKRGEWAEKSRKIIKRYRDERDAVDKGRRKFNILWSNVQTLQPALYSRNPQPYVERRYKDKDEVGRETATVLERAISYSLDEYDFKGEVEDAVLDRLLPGLGQIRVKYVPYYEKETDEEGNALTDEAGEDVEKVVYEQSVCEYIHWEDFIIIGEPRRWSEVDAIALRAYLTRDELVEQFGKEKGSQVELDHKPDKDAEDDSNSKATTYEIWDKKTGKVRFVAKSYKDDYLDVIDPPIDHDGFWPFPRPITATTTTDCMVPVPDYIQYQDQADEIDQLTGRIDVLSDALKLVGVYDASSEGLSNMLNNAVENQLVPVENWAMFAEKGGLKGAIDWLPIEQVILVLMKLYEARSQAKQDLYEVTGLSDIVRGVTNPNETLGAQQLKGQFATSRLSNEREEVARFVRDVIRLKAEIIAEQFSPMTLSLMTGIQVTDEMIALMRNDLLRGFRIDIETSSTVEADEQADKAARVEFLEASASFMERMYPMVEKSPALGKLAGKMLLFGIRGFRTGRELESAFESALDELEQQEQEPPQPSGEEIREEKELELKEREQARKEAETQHDMQIDTMGAGGQV